MRRGVVYALDARTGEVAWRFPRLGTATEAHDPRRFGLYPFLLAARGGQIIVHLPEKLAAVGPGLLAIGLDDGEILREFYPGLTFPSAMPIQERPSGARLAFWAKSEDRERTQVSVVDLSEWREIARFELPSKVSRIRACNGRVYGVMTRKGEEFCRVFAVDLERGTKYSVPVRARASRQPELTVLPDGAFLIPEGRIGTTCAFEGTWPRRGSVHAAGDAVYVRDARGLCRVDPRDGSVVWRLKLPWPGRLTIPMWHRDSLVAASGEIVALAERGHVYIVEADKGRLRAAIKTELASVWARGLARGTRLACDEERVYFSGPWGLRAYSTHPVDPERPDPGDAADPEHLLSLCRAALLDGDIEGALRMLKGVGVSVSLRPSIREEVASLLSQLDRSPAAVYHPDLWQEVFLGDGWIAGELFMEDYERLGATGPLIAIGTRQALARAAETVDNKGASRDAVFLAAEAAEILTGVRPAEKLVAHGRLHATVALWLPMDDKTFARLLPRLREFGEHDLKQLSYFSQNLSPRQYHQLFDGDPVLVRAAKLQAESRAGGEGNKEEIAITKQAPLPALGERDEF
ncbi:MAG: outer membrane protein assembly factor BamB family protein [Planctomycetota bacterium]